MATLLRELKHFYKKCWYKWRLKKCPGLDVANLFYLISKNGEKNVQKNHRIFRLFFIFWKKKKSSCEISPPKKTHQWVIILFLEVMVLLITIISKVLHMLDGPICRLRLGVQKYKTSN
jgi:hypothetical protein